MSFRYLLYSVLVGASLAADGIPSLAQTPTHTPPAGMTCQGDRIVWVNIPSHIYHFEGETLFREHKERQVHVPASRRQGRGSAHAQRAVSHGRIGVVLRGA